MPVPSMLKLPDEFVDRLKKQLGDEFGQFSQSLNKPVPVSIRVNPFKNHHKFDNFPSVPWAENAFYLPERISFTLDPLFHAGCYYVQEASSMFLEQALRSAFADGGTFKVLDLCAAPGGKSTHIVSMLPKGSLLVSNEIIASRNKILQDNITKWGSSDVVVTQNNPADFKRLPGYFDVIVVDAPCSGEGLFRKDINAVNEWSEQVVSMCAARQSDILDDVLPSLKQDGILIYSTCTYELSENDDQCKRLCEIYGMERITLDHNFEGVVNTRYGYQFYPHKVNGEGFYLAVLRKGKTEASHSGKVKEEYSSRDQKYLNEWFSHSSSFLPYRKEDELFAVPYAMKNDFPLLMKNLYIRKAGIHLGKLIRNELIPSHQLALSIDVKETIPSVDLDIHQALSYLRCESISISGVDKGWYLCEYDGFALGWIKALGNRINNYFPKELRILMR